MVQRYGLDAAMMSPLVWLLYHNHNHGFWKVALFSHLGHAVEVQSKRYGVGGTSGGCTSATVARGSHRRLVNIT